MCGERSQRLHLVRVIQRKRIHIKRTFVALTQEEHFLAIGRQYRVTVFSRPFGQVGMLARGHVVHPDISCDRRSVVLAPFILKPFPVLIQELVARRIEANHFGRRTQNLFRLSPFCRYLIQFRHGRSRKQRTAGREHNVLSVWCESGRNFRSRVSGQSASRTSVGRHHKHIRIPKTVAGKGNLLAIGRPHRRRFVGILGSQLYRLTPFGSYLVDVSLVTKQNFFSVWGDTHVTHPQRGNRHGTSHCASQHQCRQYFLHHNQMVLKTKVRIPRRNGKKVRIYLESIPKNIYLCNVFRGKQHKVWTMV